MNGVKPVISISKIILSKKFHTLAVSQTNEKDIENSEAIKKNFVPGLEVGKVGLEKSFEEKIEVMILKDEVNAYGRRISQLEFQKGER